MTAFAQCLQAGKVAESVIARWLMGKGYSVLPVYEKAEQEYKGPQLFSCDGGLTAPDMLAMKPERIMFVEAKCKTGFTWSRKYQRFETGIDIKHYCDYLKVRESTGVPLWILFLQRGGAVKDAPANRPNSPRGLFGGEILHLSQSESHRHENWGNGGMVYWATDYPRERPALRLVAGYDAVMSSR